MSTKKEPRPRPEQPQLPPENPQLPLPDQAPVPAPELGGRRKTKRRISKDVKLKDVKLKEEDIILEEEDNPKILEKCAVDLLC